MGDNGEASGLWGHLVPLDPSAKSVDLKKDKYVLGRYQKACDVVLNKPTISNKHCTIYREKSVEISDSQTTNYVIFILDHSSNGTFINGQKLHKDKMILTPNDEIAMAYPRDRIFLYRDRKRKMEVLNGLERNFSVDQILGKGNFAEVRMVTERSSGKKFAAKLIDKKRLTKTQREYLMREVEILKRMQHPGVVRYVNHFEGSLQMSIILELVLGGDLFDYVIDKGAFGEERSLFVMYQLLIAVQYLHKRGVVHRDLKPENVLMVDKHAMAHGDRVKVTDFGLAKEESSNSSMKTFCGTPSYLAPEIIKYSRTKTKGYSKAVDCWALGVVMFICLSRHTPFAEQHKGPTLEQQILKANYSFDDAVWDEISDEAKSLIRGFFVVDPEKRITVDEALIHPWLNGPKSGKLSEKYEEIIMKPYLDAGNTVDTTTGGAGAVLLRNQSKRKARDAFELSAMPPPSKKQARGGSEGHAEQHTEGHGDGA